MGTTGTAWLESSSQAEHEVGNLAAAIGSWANPEVKHSPKVQSHKLGRVSGGKVRSKMTHCQSPTFFALDNRDTCLAVRLYHASILTAWIQVSLGC